MAKEFDGCDASFNRTHIMHLDLKYGTKCYKTIFDFCLERPIQSIEHTLNRPNLKIR